MEKVDTHVLWRYPGISMHSGESLPPLTRWKLRPKDMSVIFSLPMKSVVAARKNSCCSMVGSWGGGHVANDYTHLRKAQGPVVYQNSQLNIPALFFSSFLLFVPQFPGIQHSF